MAVADTQLQNLIKITKVRKEIAITNITVVTFKASLVSPATSVGMWFDSRFVTMRSDSQGCELFHFVIIP